MALITGTLSVWDISFRWAGFDPDKYYLRYPLAVKDNFKLIMESILDGEIFCETMILEKLPPESKANPQYYIRTHIDAVYSCIWGKRYNKELLKWGLISRDDFYEWCGRRGIPYPKFWFPEGWKYDFEWPEYGTRASWARHVEPSQPGGFHVHFDIPVDAPENGNKGNESSLRSNQLEKLVVQKIATKIWQEHAEQNINISQMARHELIQKYSGAAHYDVGTVTKWLREVAPVEIKGKRGRPSKKQDKDAN